MSGWRCAGPQTYSVSRGLAAESLYRAYVASTLHGGFGVSAERKGALPRRDEPGPAHYQPPLAAPCSAGPPRGRVARASANFASQSQRIKKPDQLVSTQQVIAPGSGETICPPPAADGSSIRGGSTSVRGRVRSLHITRGRRWLSCRQPACVEPTAAARLGQLRHGTDGRIAVSFNAPYGGSIIIVARCCRS